jgi:hypothetical protein
MIAMKNQQELSDAQLDAISGGCYRPEPKKCDSYDYDPCKSKKYDDCDYKPRKKHCGESPWEKWYEKCHDFYEKYAS